MEIRIGRVVRVLVGIMRMIVVCAATTNAWGSIEAILDRDRVALGQSALLTITVSGSGDSRPRIPDVKNLIVEPRGTNERISYTNGILTRTTGYTYAVGSQQEGQYVIPAIRMTVDGKPFFTVPLKLTVSAGSGTGPPAGIQRSSSPPAIDAESGSGDEDEYGFLTVELADSERKFVYLGEIAPVRIQAWIPGGMRTQVRSGIQPEGRAFTLHNVSAEAHQTERIQGGRRFTVLTWYGGISATKAGRYPVSLSLGTSVAVPDLSRGRRRRPTGGPFDDPFFDSFFDRMNTPTIQKDVKLVSKDEEIEVRDLPEEGRPEKFRGAVGDFRFGGVEIPSEWRTGEPQTIEAEIEGSGNFALLEAPVPSPGEDWKTYQAKSQFTGGDEASFSGSKQFEFSAVTRKNGSREMALELEFFDPESGSYKTVTSAPREIRVEGNDLVFEEEAVPQDTAAIDATEMVGQKDAPERTRGLAPFHERPGFKGVLGLSVALCLLGFGMGLARVRRNDPTRAARVLMAGKILSAEERMKQARSAGEVGGYFSAARESLRLRIAEIFDTPAEGITLVEVKRYFDGNSETVRFFREADFREYGGTPAEMEWEAWETSYRGADEELKKRNGR